MGVWGAAAPQVPYAGLACPHLPFRRAAVRYPIAPVRLEFPSLVSMGLGLHQTSEVLLARQGLPDEDFILLSPLAP